MLLARTSQVCSLLPVVSRDKSGDDAKHLSRHIEKYLVLTNPCPGNLVNPA